VVRAAEGAGAEQTTAFELAGHGGDHGDFQRFSWRKIGQDAGKGGGEHGLAGAGRAAHQHIVAAGSGDFQRTAGGFLAFDIGEIGAGLAGVCQPALGRAEQLLAFKVIDERQQRGRGEDIDLAGPNRFAALGGGADEAHVMLGRMEGGEQHAGDRAEAAIQAELSDGEMAGEHILRQDVHGDEQG